MKPMNVRNPLPKVEHERLLNKFHKEHEALLARWKLLSDAVKRSGYSSLELVHQRDAAWDRMESLHAAFHESCKLRYTTKGDFSHLADVGTVCLSSASFEAFA